MYGRIKHHLKHNLWNSNNTILFVGYQAPGTLGRKIVEGAKKVKIFGEEIAVNARIEYIEGYSGHADQEWLMNFIYSFINKPKQIILVHGERTSQEELKEKILEETKIPVTIPKYGEIYEIEEEKVILEGRLELESVKRIRRVEIINTVKMLKDEMSDMEEILKTEILTEETKEDDINSITLKLKEIEKLIVSIIE
jgi:metallo-beta-lactamase family protein